MKKARVYKAEFKAAAVKRMQNVSALARELKIQRQMLYEWCNAVLAGQPLRLRGRPKRSLEIDPPFQQPVERVQELERLIGQLTAENRFFKGALQRITELRQRSKETGAAASMRRSKQ